jgi:DNA mismatch repair ATPase MutS
VENLENDNLVFDHRLKPGPLKSRNAIKILSISNYPAEIIEEANRIANKN